MNQPPKKDQAFTAFLILWGLIAIPTTIRAIITKDYVALLLIAVLLGIMITAVWIVRREEKKFDAHQEQIFRMWRY